MDIVKGSTTSETTLLKAIQTAVGALADGMIGTDTMVGIAAAVGADCFPLTLEIYDCPTIIANDILAFNSAAPASWYKNCMSGSFSYNGSPCSVAINKGKSLYDYSCHYWAGYPETVLCRYTDGTFGIGRYTDIGKHPYRASIRWAVGGMGLLDIYDPGAEGFCKFTYNGKSYDYSDVLRQTNHTMLGVKRGLVYLVYCPSVTAVQVNALARGKFKFDKAVMLDGGSVASINGEEAFAKINTGTKQYYAIQAI